VRRLQTCSIPTKVHQLRGASCRKIRTERFDHADPSNIVGPPLSATRIDVPTGRVPCSVLDFDLEAADIRDTQKRRRH
jgi:hypothetical protein